tara:strand:+ start:3860 stop:3985 length:126 start_codon:yes stop_codon:yes gene_type:complete
MWWLIAIVAIFAAWAIVRKVLDDVEYRRRVAAGEEVDPWGM